MATTAQNATLIRQLARLYAQKQGLPQAADAFADTLIAISWVESGLGQQPVGDQGQSHGLFHTHVGGRNLSGIGRRAGSVQELARALSDPQTDIQNSLPELWTHFQKQGGTEKYQADPNTFVAAVALTGQRPSRAAWESVVRQGGYANGVRIAKGATAPTSGSPLQAAAGLPSRASVVTPGAPAPARSGYVFPVQGFKGQIGLHHGSHKGAVDLMAPAGTPIVNMVDGVVESVSSEGAGGNNVTILGRDGRRYYYAHMQRPVALRQGQQVTAGTPIGLVGNTGNAASTPPHLHIGIGTNIVRGVGPSGGAGADFDAVGFLTQVQKTGGTGMVNQGQSSFYDEQIARAQREIARVQARVEQRQRQGGPDPNDPGDKEADLLSEQYASAMEAIEFYQNAKANEVKIGEALTPGAGDTSSPAEIANAETNARQFMLNAFDTVFDNDQTLRDFYKDLLLAANADKLAEVKSRIETEGLALEAGLADLARWEKEQSSQLAWMTHALERAQFIDKAKRDNALMFLPEGTDYQPGFEPSGALAGVFRSFGLNPLVLKVSKVDRAQFDPMRSIAEGEGSMGSRPNYDETSLNQTIKSAQSVQPYSSSPVTGEQVNQSVAGSGANQDLDSILAQLMGPATLDDGDIVPGAGVEPEYTPSWEGRRENPPGEGPSSAVGQPTRQYDPWERQRSAPPGEGPSSSVGQPPVAGGRSVGGSWAPETPVQAINTQAWESQRQNPAGEGGNTASLPQGGGLIEMLGLRRIPRPRVPVPRRPF